MTNFKVGDRVRVLDSDYTQESDLAVGEMGTVVRAEANSMAAVKLDSGKYDHLTPGVLFLDREIELVGTSNPSHEGVKDSENQPDMVNSPPHYTHGGIEVLDFILAYFAKDYLGGQVVKYLSRAGHKWDALEDIEKAHFYLTRKLELMRAENRPE